jgi:hypothetical protein
MGGGALICGAPAEANETMAISSNPDGAEIYLDNSFVGNAAATLKLKPGNTPSRYDSLDTRNGPGT